MFLPLLWQGRTGRVAYFIALVISSAAIMILPFLTANILGAYAGRMDPGLSVQWMLMRPFLVGIGLAVMGGTLLFFARRRMREIGLSGAWLIIFPLAPIGSLFAFAASASVLSAIPISSPVTTMSFWAEMAFGALLSVIPAGDYLSRGGSRSLEIVREFTSCDGRLNRRPFVLRLGIALAPTLVLTFVHLFILGLGFQSAGEHSFAVRATVAVVQLFDTFANLFFLMLVVASSVRRLHDLALAGWWLALFPPGFMGLVPIFMVIFNPAMLPYMFSVLIPFQLFTSLMAIGCLVLGGMLIFKRGGRFQNSYGPSDPLSPA